MEEEAQKSVALWKNLSIALAEVYEANRLPTQNFYMFSKELMRRDGELSKKDDYLILLTALCCQNNHLMGTWYDDTAIQQSIGEEVRISLKLYESCEPEMYAKYINECSHFQLFCRYTCVSSVICHRRFKAFVSTWKNIAQIVPLYFKWKNVYEKAARQKHSNLYGVKNDEAMETPPWEVVHDVLKIFEEYIRNLSRDPKNKSKYEKPLEAVGECIKAIEDELVESGEDETLADKVEQRISKILTYATQYEPFSLIGPLYVCWILEKRIFKIVAPSERIVGFTLNEKDPFPVNEQHHIHTLTIADEAKNYLFDALLGVWEKRNLGDIGLSQFLFERTMPLYSDFMKFDSIIDRNLETYEAQNSKHVTHKFCNYPTGKYTNLFLQRVSKDLTESLKVTPSLFPYRIWVTEDKWCRYIRDNKDDPPSADPYFQYSRKHFILVFKTDKKLLSAIKVLQQQTFEYAQTVVDQFERLFYFDSQGLGACHADERWYGAVSDFLTRACETIWHSTMFQLEEKFAEELEFEKYSKELQTGIVQKDVVNYVKDALTMICVREMYQKYFARIIYYSRRAWFRTYSEAQYNRLFSFFESCDISLCDQK